MNRQTIGILTCVLLWSFSYIWTKSALDYLSPSLLVAMRILIALVSISIYSKLRKKLQKLQWKDIRFIMILALIEPVGYFLFETSGVDYVNPTVASIIISLIPILSPIASWATGGEMVSRRGWMALAISLIGVVLVVIGDSEPLEGRLIGVILLVCAAFAAVFHAISVQRLTRRFNSYTIVTWQNMFATIYLIPVVLVMDFGEIQALTFSWDWFSSVLILGIFCSSVSFVLYANSIRNVGVMTTSMYVNLIPSITAIASYFMLDDSPSWLKVTGIILTVMGLFVARDSTKAIE